MKYKAIQKFLKEDVTGKLSAGTKVRIPHKGKMVAGKIVRYDGGTKSVGELPFYIVDVGEYGSVKIPVHKVALGEDTQDESLAIKEARYAKLKKALEDEMEDYIERQSKSSDAGDNFKDFIQSQGKPKLDAVNYLNDRFDGPDPITQPMLDKIWKDELWEMVPGYALAWDEKNPKDLILTSWPLGEIENQIDLSDFEADDENEFYEFLKQYQNDPKAKYTISSFGLKPGMTNVAVVGDAGEAQWYAIVRADEVEQLRKQFAKK